MADVKFETKGKLYQVNLGDADALTYPVRHLAYEPDGVVAYAVAIEGPNDPGRAWVLVSRFDGELRGYPMQRVTE